MIHRTQSEGGASSSGSSTKMWRFGSALRKFGSMSGSGRDDKNWTNKLSPPSADSEHEPSLSDMSSIHENAESNYRQLGSLIARMRGAPSGPSHIDGAYKEFAKVRERCANLCDAILRDEIKTPRTLSNATETTPPLGGRRDSSLIEAPRSPSATFDHRSSFSGRSLAEVVTGSTGRRHSDVSLGQVREWKNCLETLTETFKVSLAETYKSYEREATPEMVEALFSSKKFRREAVHRMRNASVTKILSADPQFFPRYEIRFRNYEKIKQELSDIRKLLQAGESGILPGRVIEEFSIAPRGDAVIEFANLQHDAASEPAALRFRVSSAVLAETSPIFARMFSGHSSSYYVHEAEEITDQLPPPPVQYFCDDGSEVKLFRMPQQEPNRLNSLEILMHAAHMQNEKIPREVSFEQFVAIAECCLRYKSTSPLELIVEHRWLPQWMHKGADEMPDGLLIISYTFGLRALFTRMSKSAILNLVDEQDLNSKPWPQRMKNKIWAVRQAKVDQLHASCTNTIQEYIRPPARDLAAETKPVSISELDSCLSSPIQPTMGLTSTPRCPKGSHWCDASNLGWMMMVYNELGLLPNIVQPAVLSHMPKSPQPQASLAQMMNTLRLAPSPPSPVHPGSVCDPAPAFRAAVADVYNSVTGLTLFDISGKSHGWALSKHKIAEPQMLLTAGLNRMATQEKVHSVVTEFPEEVRLQILSYMSQLGDLHAAARINMSFYDTYKRYELQLMRNILRADRVMWNNLKSYSTEDGRNEGKVLKSESDMLKERGFGDGADAITLRSEDDDGVTYSDDESDYGRSTRQNSIISQGGRSLGHPDDEDFDVLTRDPPPPFQPREANPPPALPPIRVQGENSPRARTPDGSDDADGSPTTPRQMAYTPPSQPSGQAQPELIPTEDINEPPMTDEEARRILWPDHVDVSPPAEMAVVPPGVEGLREKFLLGDLSFVEGLEEKTLTTVEEKILPTVEGKHLTAIEEKNLAGEHEKLGDGRPSSSRSNISKVTQKASDRVLMNHAGS